jgi:ubiquinone/menaquinone biosynthesis C-methylase UbiE
VNTSDLFGDRAAEYARHRPTYPEALFAHLERLTGRCELAWDCGAGSGQTARSLAGRYALVVATDASLRQLVSGGTHARVHRVAAAAEAAPLRDHCADLVTVSAALHWFDRPRFYAEVRRVARPGAILAAWSYYRTLVEPAVDALIIGYANRVVGSLWPAGMQLNQDAYRDLDFPFDREPWPELEAHARMRLDDLLQFLRTWSASQAWQRDELAHAWGDPGTERLVRWPLHGVIGRVR